MIAELRALLEQLKQKPTLFRESGFVERSEAIDTIELSLLDTLESLAHRGGQSETLARLKSAAEALRQELMAVDTRLTMRLRAEIRQGQGRGVTFAGWLEQYVGSAAKGVQGPELPGFDRLDAFVNELLLMEPVPNETMVREPEMVLYQQTPARIVLELVARAKFEARDLFYDLGSGLGQVPLLVHLLSGVSAKGVECEPAFSAYANQCALELALSRVSFIPQDARQADYADGTVFFMYTPFKGRMLQDVLKKLRADTQARQIKLFTYGPCTPQVATQSWLKREDAQGDSPDALALFTSQAEA